MFEQDTIAAIATASTGGSVSIIRISGEEAISCADQIVLLKNRNLSNCKSHTLHYGYVVDENENKVDEVIVLLMRAPNSYTREDVVEIQCHGGAFICHEILNLILKTGVRLSEPGEFTKRAFLNGRIDLSQAEAVMDLIESKSKYARESSLSQLNGIIKDKIVHIRNLILNDVAFIEAALDDPEHISMDSFSARFESDLNFCLCELKKMIDNYENGKWIREGIRTVIVGKPNVGKSSLLNTILGTDRAIVTDVPGTTRDTLEEDVRLGDLLLHIIDTAGIHDSDDPVEKIGIQRAKENLSQADLCLLLLDGSKEIDEEDIELLYAVSNLQTIILLNKNDLVSQTSVDDVKKYTDQKIISFSTKTESGREELEKYIKEQFYLDRISFEEEIYITNIRQKQAIIESYQSLNQVRESIDMNMGEDFYTIDLMSAYESLGKMIGQSVDDDLIDTIFKKFCMGK